MTRLGPSHSSSSWRLCLPGSLAALVEPKAFGRWLDPLYRQNWVTYAKRPFANAQRIFRYLGRYSHRVAIANSRLVSLEDGQVCFRWKDYADEHRDATSTPSWPAAGNCWASRPSHHPPGSLP